VVHVSHPLPGTWELANHGTTQGMDVEKAQQRTLAVPKVPDICWPYPHLALANLRESLRNDVRCHEAWGDAQGGVGEGQNSAVGGAGSSHGACASEAPRPSRQAETGPAPREAACAAATLGVIRMTRCEGANTHG
jgi:hypothetical protein